MGEGRATLTPARGVGECEGQACEQQCGWPLGGQRDAPLQVALREAAGVADPVGEEEADGVHEALEADHEGAVLGGRDFGEVDGGDGEDHAGGEAREGAADYHHGGVDGRGLHDGAEDADGRAEEEAPAAAEGVHAPGCDGAAEGAAGVVARYDAAVDGGVDGGGGVHVLLEGGLGDGCGDDARVEAIKETGGC